MAHRGLSLVLMLAGCGPSTDGEERTADGDRDGARVPADCDDDDPAVHPGADDPVGDTLDTDCDGVDGVDADGDGVASAASGGMDCDDADPDVLGTDLDADGAPSCVDCDDTDPARHPAAAESCDGIDEDCDGTADLGPDGAGVCTADFAVALSVDVLMVVDNSCSMAEEQAAMSASVSAMYDVYTAAGADFHLGVVTTDMDLNTDSGRLQQAGGVRWVDPTTPDPVLVLEAMVLLGTTGSPNERGVDAIYGAIEIHAQPGGYNDGFYRDDAVLEIVVLSDESDYSLMPDLQFENWLAGLKPSGAPVVVNALVAPPNLCPGASTPGDAYGALASWTGGVIWSVCDTDYTVPLEDAATSDLPAPTDTFALGVDVDPATLAAEVTTPDGSVTVWPAAELAWNPVTFEVTIPAAVTPGSSVRIHYAEA